jgi:hypothetical protein
LDITRRFNIDPWLYISTTRGTHHTLESKSRARIRLPKIPLRPIEWQSGIVSIRPWIPFFGATFLFGFFIYTFSLSQHFLFILFLFPLFKIPIQKARSFVFSNDDGQDISCRSMMFGASRFTGGGQFLFFCWDRILWRWSLLLVRSALWSVCFLPAWFMAHAIGALWYPDMPKG